MSTQTDARNLLAHYLIRAAPGGFYNNDSLREINSIVDLIVDAAVERAVVVMDTRIAGLKSHATPQ